MWIVVYLTQSKIDADKIGKLIEDEGIIVKIRCVNNSQDDEENSAYEILVTDSDVAQAHNIIIDAQI